MNIGEILLADCANGNGMRISVFVSGCTNHCKGCFNEETWDFSYGKPYTKEIEDYIIENLSMPYYKGLTILGGEPFEPSNQEALATLIERVRKECPDKDIWMYTGFTYDKDLLKGGCRHTNVTDRILDNIDVLVDGRFEEDLKDVSLVFKGSSNQRIIDMKSTRKTNAVKLLEL